VLSEIHVSVIEGLDERIPIKNIDAHRCLVEIGVVRAAEILEQVWRDAQLVEKFRGLRLFLESNDAAGIVRVHDSEGAGQLAVHRDGGERHVGLRFDVLLKHLAEVHAVKLIAAEDNEIFVRVLQEIAQILANRVRGPLIPARIGRRLLGRQDFHEAAGKIVEFVARIDVLMERSGIELGEDVDPAQSGIDAIAYRDIDDPIFSRERHGGFGALLGQGEEPRAGAASHHNREGFFSDRGPVRRIHARWGFRGCFRGALCARTIAPVTPCIGKTFAAKGKQRLRERRTDTNPIILARIPEKVAATGGSSRRHPALPPTSADHTKV
jgi:hypothetical protein